MAISFNVTRNNPIDTASPQSSEQPRKNPITEPDRLAAEVVGNYMSAAHSGANVGYTFDEWKRLADHGQFVTPKGIVTAPKDVRDAIKLLIDEGSGGMARLDPDGNRWVSTADLWAYADGVQPKPIHDVDIKD